MAEKPDYEKGYWTCWKCGLNDRNFSHCVCEECGAPRRYRDKDGRWE